MNPDELLAKAVDLRVSQLEEDLLRFANLRYDIILGRLDNERLLGQHIFILGHHSIKVNRTLNVNYVGYVLSHEVGHGYINENVSEMLETIELLKDLLPFWYHALIDNMSFGGRGKLSLEDKERELFCDLVAYGYAGDSMFNMDIDYLRFEHKLGQEHQCFLRVEVAPVEDLLYFSDVVYSLVFSRYKTRIEG
jgi:hypothetical protein